MDVTVACITDLCSFSFWEESYHTPSCGTCPVPVLEIPHSSALSAMLHALFEGLFEHGMVVEDRPLHLIRQAASPAPPHSKSRKACALCLQTWHMSQNCARNATFTLWV